MAEAENIENEQKFEETLEQLKSDVIELYEFRDLFFENHPLDSAAEKDKIIEEKMEVLLEKFNKVEENEIPVASRAEFLYLKGKTCNVSKYDPRATQWLSKAVKLNPRLVDAWTELGECYWKNLNILEAKNSFEGALKQERNRVALRCMSIILRQESTHSVSGSGLDHKQVIQKSVELAKEAVAKDPSDGVSWCVLGNAQLCQYFLVSQSAATLQSCLRAYSLAQNDPVARGRPDLYNNWGVALKYDEQYTEALQYFDRACRLDPTWDVPIAEKKKLETYLLKVNDLISTRGKIKTKKIMQMVQSIDTKMAAPYLDSMTLLPLTALKVGENKGAVVMGKVIGSVHSENLVPFTFALLDGVESLCVVSVYNWAGGRGVIIGDAVALPTPLAREHSVVVGDKECKFRSIRVNNPMTMLVNGKKIGRNQCAGARLTSTYEVR